jgi:hypothetical protein
LTSENAAKIFAAKMSLFKVLITILDCQTDISVLSASALDLARCNDADSKTLLRKMSEEFIEAHKEPKREEQQ